MTKIHAFAAVAFSSAAIICALALVPNVALAAAGPVAYWPFDENGGTTAFDATANANDGTINGSAAYTTSGIAPIPGNVSALTFDGVDDFVEVAHNGSLDMTGEYRISAWLNVTDFATYRPIVYRGTTDANDIEVYVQQGTGNLIVQHNDGNGAPLDYVGFANPPIGTLFKLDIVFDGTNVQAYYDGVAAAVVQGASAMDTPLGTDKGWWIGKVDHNTYGGAEVFYFKGLIDELQIFDRSEIVVTLIKYIDGEHATAANANSSSFPMSSCWDATNIGAGCGAFALSTVGFNNPNPYEATTSDMSNGADYSVNEDLTGGNVGASCAEGKPFALVGYSVGSSELDAANQAPSASAPALTDISADQYIVVWNEDCTPTLRVTKIVTNDNGGTATTTDFALFIDGNPVASGVDNDVSVGAHVVSETPQSGYGGTFGGACDSSGNVSLAAGEHKECTITNDDEPGTLIVQKVLINNNGGTAATTTFSFTVNAGTSTPFEADAQNDVTVDAGTYDVVEDAAVGYTTTYTNSQNANANCDDLVVPNGGTVICTITNDDQPGTLIVTKVLINDSTGLATTTTFSFTVNGATSTAFEADGSNSISLDAGVYTVVENPAVGYTTTYENSLDLDPDCASLAVGVGEVVECTITNNDLPPPPADACTTLVTPAGYTLQNGTPGNDNLAIAPFTMFVGMGGKDKVRAGDGDYVICLSSGDDNVNIGSGAFTVDLGSGKNTMVTRHGPGVVVAGSGKDTIVLGNGIHIVNAGDGDNTVVTMNGNKTITTGSGNDKVITGSGNDVISVGNGSNTVISGAGADMLTGGAGKDVFNAGPDVDACDADGGTNTVVNCAP